MGRKKQTSGRVYLKSKMGLDRGHMQVEVCPGKKEE
jgi:hypothetical protein